MTSRGYPTSCKYTLALAAGVLALTAGCTTPAADRSTTPAQPLPSSAVPVPFTSPTPIPGLRPLTPAQRQRRDLCRHHTVKNGCEFYTDDSLRLQGIDPDSAPEQSGPKQSTIPTT